MPYVQLSRGQRAVIDVADLPMVVAYTWHAIPNGMGGYYACSTIAGHTTYMHRLIAGARKGEVVDHWNHDTLDNRRENLRPGTQADNMRNGKFALATHCPRAHAYDANNARITMHGHRVCRECHRQDERRRREQFGLTAEQRARKGQRQRERRARRRLMAAV